MSIQPIARVVSPHSTDELRCEIAPDRDVVTVLVSGELDIATVQQLDATLRELLDAGFQRLRVDLRDLEFIDVRGVALIRRWRELSALAAFGLTIDVKAGPVQRTMDLLGVPSAP